MFITVEYFYVKSGSMALYLQVQFQMFKLFEHKVLILLITKKIKGVK
jgi:hypothetical protein